MPGAEGVSELELTMEEWRDITGYPGYQVSEFGRVRSRRRAKMRTLELPQNYAGYRVVGLRTSDGQRKQFRVNRLVLEAFIGECPEGFQSNHRNGNKSDNRLENLEWVSPKENSRHAYLNGLANGPLGSKNGHARLKDGEVWLLRRLAAATIISEDFLAKMFRISRSHAHEIIACRAWVKGCRSKIRR